MLGNKSLSNFSFYFLFQVTNTGFQLLLLPLIINSAEPLVLAQYFICLSVAGLLSLFVNFGTNTTSVIDLQKANSSNTIETEKEIYTRSFQIRIIPLLISFLVIAFLYQFSSAGKFYLIAFVPVLAEFFSPIFFLLYKNNLKSNFQINLFLKATSLIILILLKSNPHLPQWALLLQGLSALILYLILIFQIQSHYSIQWRILTTSFSLKKSIELAPVVGNNLITHLQQSLFLFSLPAIASPVFVAAYGFIDKIVGSIRMLVNTYNTSYFPQANIEYGKGIEHWKNTRQFQNRIISALSLAVAIIFFLFPDILLNILLLGGSAKSASFIQTGTELIRMIALVPLVISLNALNVAEIMMAGLYRQHFLAGLLILALTAFSAFLSKWVPNEILLGYYPLIIESFTLLIYLTMVYQYRKKIPSLLQ